MKNLPPLTTLLAKGPEAGHEFERLMKKLLIHDGSLKGYMFEPGVTIRDEGVDGMVKQNYPGMKTPVIFQFKWLQGPINKGSDARQIKDSLAGLVKFGIQFNSYVLVTPHDLKHTENKWLENLPVHYKRKFDIFHYGHTRIQVLLDAYPALKKYYYGEQVDGVSQNFNALREKYRKAMSDEVKHLQFIGMPTGHYQKQHVLEKPELAKIYIPLEFNGEKESSSTATLENILKQSPRVVVLGDPGSGKSTLAKYLASIHCQDPGDKGKIPFIIPIREFVRLRQEKKSQTINFIDYLKYKAEADFQFSHPDEDFFIAMLELGKAIVVFDGLDEVASESGRTRTAKNIQQFCLLYPDSPVWVTSRIVGYTVDVKLDHEVFNHYRLAPVTPKQAGEFIEKWYEIQLPNNERERKDRVQSLQKAIEENPGVQRLKTNPLLLTMMTLVHQFEGTLPDDRAKLYEKCIELLLKTWQDQKYLTLGLKNPMEQRDLTYNDQLKMLAAAAFYLQEKNQDREEAARGLIEEKELEEVLFDARYNKKRMTEESAWQDVEEFLDYIRDRAGLLVEKGRNETGENVFAFVHLSFLEYLCAYQVAEDKSKSQQDHIRELLGYLDKPTWEEPILLSLYLFAGSTGPSFIDAFSEAVIEKLTAEPAVIGWFLLGRAVRDNIKFALEDIKRICAEILEIWLDQPHEETSFSILREIFRFSKQGQTILKDVIKESIKTSPAPKAFDSLYVYEQLYPIDPGIPELIFHNKDSSDLLPYLPVYRENEIIAGYIEENLIESHWVMFYNSTVDKTNEYLKKLLTGKLNPRECKGFTISTWSKIFKEFEKRNQFLEINKFQFETGIIIERLSCDFGGQAQIDYTLGLFQPFVEKMENLSFPTLANPRFLSKDKNHYFPLESEFLAAWLSRLLLNMWRSFEKNTTGDRKKTASKKKQVTINLADFSQNFKLDFILYLGRDFRRDINLQLKIDIIIDFILDLRRDFILNLSRNLNRNLSRNLNRNLSRYLKDFTSEAYYKKYNKKLKWHDLSERDEEMVFYFFVDQLEKGKIEFIESFIGSLNIYLLYDEFELSFDSFDSAAQSLSGKEIPGVTPNRHLLSINNPISIPYTIDFILISAFIHYFIYINSELNLKFYEKKNHNKREVMDAAEDYIETNPFDFYFITYSWDFYAKAFNERYQQLKEGEAKEMALAAFLVNAARVSLVAGVPCEGDEWEKTLIEAGKSTHPFVQISLTLYQLCNFIDRETNSRLLTSHLEKFKRDYPAFYKLIGFQAESEPV